MNLYDVVELKEVVPSEQLSAGAVGTIVHIFRSPPTAYEVEFSDADGRTIALITLAADQIHQHQG
ncbi:DUF4926 domain-containing protein [Micromonospora costi]|uniref:DUF4926 domain-containing protein n=1 Tax=Micromonospora costi TaxID=1530042 RepID=UPI0033F59616